MAPLSLLSQPDSWGPIKSLSAPLGPQARLPITFAVICRLLGNGGTGREHSLCPARGGEATAVPQPAAHRALEPGPGVCLTDGWGAVTGGGEWLPSPGGMRNTVAWALGELVRDPDKKSPWELERACWL